MSTRPESPPDPTPESPLDATDLHADLHPDLPPDARSPKGLGHHTTVPDHAPSASGPLPPDDPTAVPPERNHIDARRVPAHSAALAPTTEVNGPLPSVPTDPERLTKAQRRVKALHLRIAGHDYRTIAGELGVALKTAWGDVQDALRYLAKLEHALVEEVRALESQRLDALSTALWPQCMLGDYRAIDTFLKIMDRRAKLLGLDAPIQVDLSASARPYQGLSDEALGEKVKGLLKQVNAAPKAADQPGIGRTGDDG